MYIIIRYQHNAARQGNGRDIFERCVMANVKLVIILLTAILSLAAPSFGQDKYVTDDLRTFSGKVVSLDVGSSSLVVNNGQNRDFPIASETAITKNGAGIRLSDIGIGDYVTIGYYKTDGAQDKVLTVRVEYPADDNDSW
jgi:hypothetical protein